MSTVCKLLFKRKVFHWFRLHSVIWLWWYVQGSTVMFPCHWSPTAMSRCNFTESANMKNMDLAQCEPSHVLVPHEQIPCFDRFFCCWFSQVIVSTPRAADRSLIDRRCRRARHRWQPKARSLWKSAKRKKMSIGMETQVYFICLPKCKGESAWETHMRERDGERQSQRGQAPSKSL